MTDFTFSYVQPDEYRFSLDSVEAPRAVAAWARAGGLKPRRVLDLCAGCGVMGLEFAFHFPESFEIDFLEIQPVYRPFFGENVRRLQQTDRDRGLERSLRTRWLELNYESLQGPEFHSRYDLILSNPPYFLPDQGRLSPSEFKNRCRFFLDASPETLWDATAAALAPGGSAFLLVRPLSDHSETPFEDLARRLRYQARVERWQDIRGTDLVRVSK